MPELKLSSAAWRGREFTSKEVSPVSQAARAVTASESALKQRRAWENRHPADWLHKHREPYSCLVDFATLGQKYMKTTCKHTGEKESNACSPDWHRGCPRGSRGFSEAPVQFLRQALIISARPEDVTVPSESSKSSSFVSS